MTTNSGWALTMLILLTPIPLSLVAVNRPEIAAKGNFLAAALVVVGLLWLGRERSGTSVLRLTLAAGLCSLPLVIPGLLFRAAAKRLDRRKERIAR